MITNPHNIQKYCIRKSEKKNEQCKKKETFQTLSLEKNCCIFNLNSLLILKYSISEEQTHTRQRKEESFYSFSISSVERLVATEISAIVILPNDLIKSVRINFIPPPSNP